MNSGFWIVNSQSINVIRDRRFARNHAPQLKIAFLLCGFCALAVNMNSLAADVVHQRGGLPAIEGQIVRIDEAGVTIDRGLAEPQMIRWDLVGGVVMEHSDPALESYREDAANLWRARTRLERHDAAVAEPLFERLFEKYRGQTHETSLVVAEGLLRCRLARGAHDAAVIPALETARLRRALKNGATIYSVLPPVLDDRTALCTALPPAWLMSSVLIKLERDLAAYDAGNDLVIAAIASLYRRAAAQQLNIRIDDDATNLAADHAGVSLLRTMVDAQSTDSTRRQAARLSLQRDASSASNWVQAWSYYVIGASLLGESGVGQQERGMVNLAYLPSRFGTVQPYLAALALAKLADACDALGEATAATSLRAELAARFPNHPATRLQKPKSQIDTTIQPDVSQGTTIANRTKESS